MCCLFGMIRNQSADPGKATVMCLALGMLAVERGRDAAGLAMAAGQETKQLRHAPSTHRRDVTAGGWRIVKGAGTFTKVWKPEYADTLRSAPAALGHTRWATQGNRTALVNASPLQVGQLIGTHNGDVDKLRLERQYDLSAAVGQTDTEVLFQALDGMGGIILPTVEVLENAVGRAALAWTDRRWPGLVMLARTAISPLAIAVDSQGNLYWASNPAWFAKAAKTAGARIDRKRIWLMPEGMLLLIDYSRGAPCRVDAQRFIATARAKDNRLAPIAAYRGFSLTDEKRDAAGLSHITLPDPVVRPVKPYGGDVSLSWWSQ
jgi:glutamine---fructose-6-phosphate transaminase (isomerizing)